MPKSADAFRTISEVADWLETPAHVLRFWESKFSQVKPVKRAGGRRYYRPADMHLLGGIKKLLRDDGMTIKGVQKILREHGVKHVSSMSQPLDEELESEDGGVTLDAQPSPPQSATVVDFKSSANTTKPNDTSKTTSGPAMQPDAVDEAAPTQAPDTLAADTADTLAPPKDAPSDAPSQAPDTLAGGAPDGVEDTVNDALAEAGIATKSEDAPPDTEETVMPSFRRHRDDESETLKTDDTSTEGPGPSTRSGDTIEAEAETEPDTAQAPAPARVDVPTDPEDDLATDPGLLSLLLKCEAPLDPAVIEGLTPLMQRLRDLQANDRAAG
jgi:DNA-binding transcriptional MerR regulator